MKKNLLIKYFFSNKTIISEKYIFKDLTKI